MSLIKTYSNFLQIKYISGGMLSVSLYILDTYIYVYNMYMYVYIYIIFGSRTINRDKNCPQPQY